MNFDYTQEKLVLPEYGRIVQKMVQIAMGIEDREERNRCARTIINIMGSMFPQQRETLDYRSKLWNHLFLISDYKLDVDAPVPIEKPDFIDTKPERLPYPDNHIKMKHYGFLVENFIDAAKDLKDKQYQKVIVRDIANYMKKTLLALNKDFATDERLFSDIKALSNNSIEIDENARTINLSINDMNDYQKKQGKKKKNRHKRNKDRKNQQQ